MQVGVDGCSEDDVRLRVGRVRHDLGGLADLDERQIGAAGDAEQNPAGAIDGRLQQGRQGGGLGRLDGAVATAGVPDAQKGRAGVANDRAHVGKVEVDQARQGDQVADALHTLTKQVVGDPERVDHAGAALEDAHQPIVRDDDDRIGGILEALQPLVGGDGALLALESERPGHDGNGQSTELTGNPRDDRGATATGAATLTRRDEDEVAAAQSPANQLFALLQGQLAALEIATGAKAAGQLETDRNPDVGLGCVERLAVGVDRDELNAAKAGFDHPVDRVAAGTTDADDTNDRDVVRSVAAILLDVRARVPWGAAN